MERVGRWARRRTGLRVLSAAFRTAVAAEVAAQRSISAPEQHSTVLAMLQRRSQAGRHPRLFALATLVAAALLVEAAAHLAVLAANPFLPHPIVTQRALFDGQSRAIRMLFDSARRDQHHPILGWSYRAGYAADGDTLNQAGMRSSREYPLLPTDSLTRVAAFGDSFVYCTEASNDACWSSQMETDWLVEVLNYGVGGYGTDQSLLRYLLEGRRYSPSIVVVGFAPVNVRRTVNRFRRFLSPREGPWFKPRFKLVEGDLRVIPTPIPSLADARTLLADPTGVRRFGTDDHWYEPAIYEHRLYRMSATYRILAHAWIWLRQRHFDADRLYQNGVLRTESEAFKLQKRLLTGFADSITAAGSTPALLFLPNRGDVRRRAQGEAPSYEPLSSLLREMGLVLIDPLDAFTEAGVREADLFAPRGHYSETANRILAQVVASGLSIARR